MNQEYKNKLLHSLQKGLPIEPRPFQSIAQSLDSTEEEVIAQIKELFQNGTARRLGGIFDARRLGYKSALCAVIASPDQTDHLADIITPHPGVTHCYLRGWPEELSTDIDAYPGNDNYPTLWFTLAVPAEDFDKEICKMTKGLAPAKLLVLPAIRRFKIDVIFDTRERDMGERFPGAAPSPTAETVEEFHSFTEKEKKLVRVMDGNMALNATPFDDISKQADMNLDEVLSILSKWKEAGVLRRIALILRHHKIGFKANAMCLWHVPEQEAKSAGRALAANREVTHCYQRPLLPLFNYNLFAMIHTQSWQDTHQLFLKISDNAGLSNGKMLCSVKEYKKTSMKYFQEN